MIKLYNYVCTCILKYRVLICIGAPLHIYSCKRTHAVATNTKRGTDCAPTILVGALTNVVPVCIYACMHVYT